MAAVGETSDLGRITAERDLYRRLLELGRHTSLDPFLRESLALIVDLTGAQHAYLEFFDDSGDAARWSISHALDEEQVGDVRGKISRGIIAEALAAGETIVTPAALLDPRFHERNSVQLGQIEAVLCCPIGEDGGEGVLYLQGRAGAGLFPEDDQRVASLFARHVAPHAQRLVAHEHQAQANDPTRPLRESLRLEGIVGRSPALASVFRQVALVAPLDVTVLLTGESGTGKSLLARVIHDNGLRANKPFIEVNCGALPDSLIESELFGALPGAHSTATKRVEGKVTAAQGGTLFLDEIALLTPPAQAKLLQLLQSKQYFPLGSSTPLQANIRVIAATNVNLEKAVAEREFREDLYYRLHVLPVRVPTLAERQADLAELATHLCLSACERDGLPAMSLSRNALRAIEAAPWPGNIRQLANMIEAAAIRAAGEGATQIEAAHVFLAGPIAAASTETEALTFQEATRRFQRQVLETALEESGWNVVETARRLDLTRSHVYNLLRAFGLERRAG